MAKYENNGFFTNFIDNNESKNPGYFDIHLASSCIDEDESISSLLMTLRNGFNPNLQNDQGRTPLHLAAQLGHKRAIIFLLHNGADPLRADLAGLLPVDIAEKCCHSHIVEFLTQWCDTENYDFKNKFHYSLDFKKRKVLLISTLDDDPFLTEDFISCEEEVKALEQIEQDAFNIENPSLSTFFSCDSQNFFELDPSNMNFNFSLESYLHTLHCELEQCLGLYDEACERETLEQFEQNLKILETDNLEGLAGLPIQDSTHVFNNSETFTNDANVDPFFDAFDDDASTAQLSFRTIVEEYLYTDLEENISLIERRCSGNITLQKLVDLGIGSSVLAKKLDMGNNSSRKKEMDCFSATKSSEGSISLSPSIRMLSGSGLRRALKEEGFCPGPVTSTTRRVLQLFLAKLKKRPGPILHSQISKCKQFSRGLFTALKDPTSLDFKYLEELEQKISQQFSQPDSLSHWRDGRTKHCFNYILLDPRITKNLPLRSSLMSLKEKFEIFIDGIFYIGKGSRTRPYFHLYDAINGNRKSNKTSAKVERIRQIWDENMGVISLHLYQNTIPVEAWTREACMIAAIGVENLANSIQGSFYGIASTWRRSQQQHLGVFLLYKALHLLLYEGERHLHPEDIPTPPWKS